jgi:FkbH-like protein
MIIWDKIKLIIWDLDDTLWDGTISEGKVSIPNESIEFIKNTTDAGIVNSICSKNDYSVAKKELCDNNLWEYFVFPSIDWSGKGERVKAIISSMNLRPVNVLFVDDNPINLKEVEYYSEGIMVCSPEELKEYYEIAKAMEKKDLNHDRLSQYKILENKNQLQTQFSSNDEFLMSCNILVDIHYDCENHIERIYDLIQRSNQLNFTKIRSSKEELYDLIRNDSIKSGYVTVKDNFGDYGIVGFFAVLENEFIHYVFSCRTLGMKVEQYVYMQLGCPEIKVVGDVSIILNDKEMPKWINRQTTEGSDLKRRKLKNSIIIKGPCDMSQMFSFIEDNHAIHTEFTYVGKNGISVEGHNHTAQIMTALTSTEQRKKEILSDVDWFDADCLSTELTKQTFDYVILSMFTDGNLGVYRRKSTGEYLAMLEGYYDLTDPENWDKYINHDISNDGISFTKDNLQEFSKKYESVQNDEGEFSIQCLDYLYKFLSKATKLVLVLPSERKYPGKTRDSYKDRHLKHKTMNDKIKNWAQGKDRVIVIPIDKHISDDRDFLDTINHFVKKVYYKLAQEIIEIVSEDSQQLHSKGKVFLLKEQVFHFLYRFKHKILRVLGLEKDF